MRFKFITITAAITAVAAGLTLGAPPAAAGGPAPEVIVAIRGTDNAVWVRTLPDGSPPSGLRAWASLGGATLSSPAVSRTTVVIRGTDNAVWVNQHSSPGTSWDGWQSLGGLTAEAPSTNAYGDVVIRGIDGRVYVRYHVSGATYDPWESLGGNATGSPAITAGGTVVVRGADGVVYLNRLASGSYVGWQSLGGATTDTPSVLEFSSLIIAIRGLDGAVWTMAVSSGGTILNGWTTHGGSTIGAPTIAGEALIARSAGGQLYGNGGSGWLALPGRFAGPVAFGAIGVVGRGFDQQPYLVAGLDSPPTGLGGLTLSDPAVSALVLI